VENKRSLAIIIGIHKIIFMATSLTIITSATLDTEFNLSLITEQIYDDKIVSVVLDTFYESVSKPFRQMDCQARRLTARSLWADPLF